MPGKRLQTSEEELNKVSKPFCSSDKKLGNKIPAVIKPSTMPIPSKMDDLNELFCTIPTGLINKSNIHHSPSLQSCPFRNFA